MPGAGPSLSRVEDGFPSPAPSIDQPGLPMSPAPLIAPIGLAMYPDPLPITQSHRIEVDSSNSAVGALIVLVVSSSAPSTMRGGTSPVPAPATVHPMAGLDLGSSLSGVIPPTANVPVVRSIAGRSFAVVAAPVGGRHPQTVNLIKSCTFASVSENRTIVQPKEAILHNGMPGLSFSKEEVLYSHLHSVIGPYRQA